MDRNEKEGDKERELEITPMIDVTFLLLIFFMCSIKFKQLEGKLDSYLPRDAGIDLSPMSPPPEPIRVRLRVAGDRTVVALNGTTLTSLAIPRFPRTSQEEQELRAPLAMDDLRIRVGSLHRQAPELTCVIDPDERVPNLHVIAALDACLAAGLQNINFTVPPGKRSR
jgi:biopolymer transport protein ExbD